MATFTSGYLSNAAKILENIFFINSFNLPLTDGHSSFVALIVHSLRVAT